LLVLQYSQKRKLVILMIYTWIMDFIWIFYWGVYWNRSQFDNNWAKGIQMFVLIMSIIEFIIKVRPLSA